MKSFTTSTSAVLTRASSSSKYKHSPIMRHFTGYLLNDTMTNPPPINTVPSDFKALPANGVLPNSFSAVGCELVNTSTIKPITCFHCASSIPTTRCFECNTLLCFDCSHKFTSECKLREHMLLPIFQQETIVVEPNSVKDKKIVICKYHSDPVKFYCKRCNDLICQKCILNMHNGHYYVAINGTVDIWRTGVMKTIEDTKTGIKIIIDAIDRAMAMSKASEKEYMEAHMQIRIVMHCYGQKYGDCQKDLINKIEKIRQTKENELSNYIRTLRGMLVSLDDINKTLVGCMNSSGLNLFMVKEYGRCKVDHILYVFWNMSKYNNMPSYCDLISQLI